MDNNGFFKQVTQKTYTERRMKKIKSYFLIFFGVVLLSASISLFCVPNKIVSGGVSGISTILFYLFKIPVGLSYYAINIILLAFGYRVLGKKFVLKTLICSGLAAILTDIFSHFPPLTNDVVLASLFGGLLGGLGIGLTLIENASTGGTDVVGRLVQSKFEHISIGKLLMIVDAAVIGASFLVFGNINRTLYGVMSLYVSGTAIDVLIKRMNVSKVAFVISQKGEEIAKKLIESSKRGVTILNATGAYTMNKNKMLVCALKEYETASFQSRILGIDPDAFIVFCESEQIVGNGFYVYH